MKQQKVFINIRFTLVLAILCLNLIIGIGQVETFYVRPSQIDSNYSLDEDSIAVSVNTNSQIDKLFLFIGGTSSSSSKAYNALRLHSASMGISFINLSYPNTVAAASLSDDSDINAFDHFRQEICFGTPLSSAVEVDSFNSIYSRTLNLLNYLALNHPSDNWDKYLLSSNVVDWSKVIIGGHSQGAGHAAYLAKHYLVDRVLMFSGPNDYSDFYGAAAIWLSTDGTTPVSRHFAYLSLNDEVVDFSKQYLNLSALGMAFKDDTTYVDNILTPFNNSHFLYTTQTPGLVILNHSVPVKLSVINNDVWTHMLNSDIISKTQEYVEENKILVYPNPTTDEVYIDFSYNIKGEKYAIYNAMGRKVIEGILHSDKGGINLLGLKNGVYFLTIKGECVQFLKL